MSTSSLRETCGRIVGVANTAYMRGTDQSTLELHLEASLVALADAGIEPGDVDAVMPQRPRRALRRGVHREPRSARPHVHLHHARSGGASLGSAIQSACLAVAGGIATCVLMPSGPSRLLRAARVDRSTVESPVLDTVNEFERPYGNLVAAQWFAAGRAAPHVRVRDDE